MKRKLIKINMEDYPIEFSYLLKDSTIYDSSCSPEARVIFIDKGCGYFLKSGNKGSLKNEYDMGRFFHGKGLGGKAVMYLSSD